MLDRITQGDPQIPPLWHFDVTGRVPAISVKQSTYKKGDVIYGQSEAAEYVYQVETGAVRTHWRLSDGRRHIGAFHLVGDIFGLETGEYRFTAEAIVETRVRFVRRSLLDECSVQDPAVAARLLRMTTTNLRHAEDRLLLLGRKSAMERVAAFLLEMDERRTTHDVLPLPIASRHRRLPRLNH